VRHSARSPWIRRWRSRAKPWEFPDAARRCGAGTPEGQSLQSTLRRGLVFREPSVSGTVARPAAKRGGARQEEGQHYEAALLIEGCYRAGGAKHSSAGTAGRSSERKRPARAATKRSTQMEDRCGHPRPNHRVFGMDRPPTRAGLALQRLPQASSIFNIQVLTRMALR
jgi:hypothetical protein